MDILKLTELSPDAFSFEMHTEDNFGIVLQKYMEEQKLSVTGLARKSGLSFNSIVRYRAGHIPNDYIVVVMLCIGLKINISKAEYLFRLAHFSLGTDKCSLVYRLLINLSFVSDITIEYCNDFLVQNGFPSLKTTSNFMKGEKKWNQNQP